MGVILYGKRIDFYCSTSILLGSVMMMMVLSSGCDSVWTDINKDYGDSSRQAISALDFMKSCRVTRHVATITVYTCSLSSCVMLLSFRERGGSRNCDTGHFSVPLSLKIGRSYKHLRHPLPLGT